MGVRRTVREDTQHEIKLTETHVLLDPLKGTALSSITGRCRPRRCGAPRTRTSSSAHGRVPRSNAAAPTAPTVPRLAGKLARAATPAAPTRGQRRRRRRRWRRRREVLVGGLPVPGGFLIFCDANQSNTKSSTPEDAWRTTLAWRSPLASVASLNISHAQQCTSGSCVPCAPCVCVPRVCMSSNGTLRATPDGWRKSKDKCKRVCWRGASSETWPTWPKVAGCSYAHVTTTAVVALLCTTRSPWPPGAW